MVVAIVGGMHRRSIALTIVFACGVLVPIAACGGKQPAGYGATGSSSGSGGSSSGGSGSGSGGVLGTGSSGSGVDAGYQCPAGLSCDVSCPNGTSTTLTGTVLDPAGKNPLYDVAVYVPVVALQPLPRGVPTGADACSCPALYQSGAITTTQTAVDGTFTLKNVPVGASVPLVLQIGKWRRLLHVAVTGCQANAQPAGSLTLPGSVPAGDTDDNMPDIAVSTGYADTLECLMIRMGVAASEYVGGAATTGHIHLFAGGESHTPANTLPGGAETPATPGAPASSTDLWSTQAQLMPYDITLLSCEGGETYDANPPALEAYLNAGGRVFASHFQYSWFSGPFSSKQGYAAPADWGTNLATWSNPDSSNYGPIGGVVDTTLNGSTAVFPKGQALAQWLGVVSALSTGAKGVTTGDLPIYDPRYNAVVAATNKPAQPWITSDGSGSGAEAGQTMYFSFDTPVVPDPTVGPDGGGPSYCGRAVFSDLHVGGSYTTKDAPPAPGGCVTTDLSAQEKVLEFMLFDLSSCVVPDTIVPPPPNMPVQ